MSAQKSFLHCRLWVMASALVPSRDPAFSVCNAPAQFPSPATVLSSVMDPGSELSYVASGMCWASVPARGRRPMGGRASGTCGSRGCCFLRCRLHPARKRRFCNFPTESTTHLMAACPVVAGNHTHRSCDVTGVTCVVGRNFGVSKASSTSTESFNEE